MVNLPEREAKMRVKSIRKNMTEISMEDASILVSYETPVAVVFHKTSVVWATNEKFSKTTSRHINEWLSQNNFIDYSYVDQEKLESAIKI